MSSSSDSEKRRFTRVGAELKVRISFGGTNVDYPAVFARDVSFGGLGLEISSKWPGFFEQLMSWTDPVDLAFDLPPDHTSHAQAVVVWGHIKEVEGGVKRFRMGLRFVKIDKDEKSRLLDFVRSKTVESMLEDDKARREGRPPTDRLP